MGGTKLNAPVQSLGPDGDGVGYWLVASDGGIFSFESPFKGSMGAIPLNKPVTGMVRYGDGYLMVAEDGGIFNFSNLPFSGSLGDRPPAHPIVAVAAFERLADQMATTTAPSLPTGSEDAVTTTTTATPATTTTTTPSTDPPVVDPNVPRCFGYPADVIGTSGDDSYHADADGDINDDNVVAIVGLGGDDTYGNGDIDSGTWKDVVFCGGDGEDRATGWVWSYDGGAGQDSAKLTACRLGGHEPELVNVEEIEAESTCPDDIP
jgi:hypothetical protein